MKETTIDFGAFDSELIAQEWAIPEGYTAKVENGKVIVEKKKPELTEFDMEVCKISNLCLNFEMVEEVKAVAEELLEIAKKELKKGFVLLHKDDYNPDLPKWKKSSIPLKDTIRLMGGDTRLYKDGYYIDIEELFNELPKEE